MRRAVSLRAGPRPSMRSLRRCLCSAEAAAAPRDPAPEPRPKPRPSRVEQRPELDFEYLLDPAKEAEIRRNVAHRKQVGDVGRLHDLWAQLSARLQTPPPEASDSEDDTPDGSGSSPDAAAAGKADPRALAALWEEFYAVAASLPNRTSSRTPLGGEEAEEELGRWGPEPDPAFRAHPGEDFGGRHNGFQPLLDTCGERAYSLQGAFARLERALLRFVRHKVARRGFRFLHVPDVLPAAVPEACGLSQRSEHGILYRLVGSHDLCLSGTGEMGIAARLAGRNFREEELEGGLRFAALSRCFRPEISRGRTAHGLFRVHEFTKVELFGLTLDSEEASRRMLEEFTELQKEILSELGLRFRLLQMPSGELGKPAFEKLDCEAWFPGRGFWGEVSSASDCTDFQSRRLGIAYEAQGQRRFPHTLNATAAASTRLLLALLETHLKPSLKRNGRLFLDLPDALQPFLPQTKAPTAKARPINPRAFLPRQTHRKAID